MLNNGEFFSVTSSPDIPVLDATWVAAGGAWSDGLNWDLLSDSLGNSKNAKSMLPAHRTPPALSTGIRPNAEVAVRAANDLGDHATGTVVVSLPLT